MPLDMALSSRTSPTVAVEILDQRALQAVAVPVEQLELASEALNLRTTSVEAKNLDEMALHAAVIAVENLEMGRKSLNSGTGTAAAELADGNLDEMAPEVAAVVENSEMASKSLNSTIANGEEVLIWPSFVHTFSPLTEKTCSEIPARKQEYLVHCLLKLARSSCSGDSATSTPSNATTTTSTSTAIKDDKQTQVQQSKNKFYNCTECNKSFSTYQALGGHKGIHRNKSTKHENPLASAPLGNVSTVNPSKKPHICPICNESFNTGQALGGHKRSHYKRQVGSPSGEGSEPITHDFVLNQTAPPDLELRLGFNVDLEVKTGNHQTESPLPLKKRRLPLAVDLSLALPEN